MQAISGSLSSSTTGSSSVHGPLHRTKQCDHALRREHPCISRRLFAVTAIIQRDELDALTVDATGGINTVDIGARTIDDGATLFRQWAGERNGLANNNFAVRNGTEKSGQRQQRAHHPPGVFKHRTFSRSMHATTCRACCIFSFSSLWCGWPCGFIAAGQCAGFKRALIAWLAHAFVRHESDE